MKIHGRVFPSRRTSFKETDLGTAFQSDGLIAINCRDETFFRESASSFADHWIADEGLRCVDEEACLLIRPLDFDPTIAIHL